jgi:hypothetical protein
MSRSSHHVTVGGAPEGFDARLVLKELEASGGCVAHVARDDRRLAAMEAALRFFDPGLPIFTFPAWDVLPYDRVSPNPEIAAARMATLAALVHGMPERFVLLTTLNAATQRVPAREVLRQAAFSARVGDRVEEGACGRSSRDGVHAVADGDGARRLCGARGAHRRVAAGASRRRCGSTSSGTRWTGRGASMRRRSGRPESCRSWSSRRCPR